MRILRENNSCRQRYLYNCKCFSYENLNPKNKVHGKVACSDYIGSMKKAIEVESLTKEGIVLGYLVKADRLRRLALCGVQLHLDG